ncbi:class II myosin [Hypoxylon texense]
MSDNPYRYGHHSGQQSQQPFAQSSTPNLTAHYGAYHQPNVPAGNYAAVNNSYQYNANNIPGLGMGASLPPTSYQLEANGAWPLPPHAAQHHNSVQTQKSTPTSGEANPRKDASEQGVGVTSSQAQIDSSLEEGELSEGEFEDLYEPKDTMDTTIPGPQLPNGSEHRDGSIGDADESSIYDGATPQEVTNSTSTSLPTAEREYSPGGDWEPTYQERERSGSYSPYLSPREIQRKVSVSKPSAHEVKPIQAAQATMQSLPGIGMASTQHPQATVPLSNGAHYPRAVVNGNTAGVEPSASAKESASILPFRSVAEAKKKAQEAILGLWPLKVRYQDYIEEGVNEKMIKGLFTELGLDASLPKSASTNKVVDDAQIPASSTSDSSKALPETQPAKDQPSAAKPKQTTMIESTASTRNMSGPKTPGKSAAEERKDKIARKLAAKAQKPVVAQPPIPAPDPQPAPAQPIQTRPTPGNPSTATPAIASPAKTKTRAENNAILHQKLAALKKAQEARAIADKKLITETLTKPASPLAVSTGSSVTNSSSKGPMELSTSSPIVAIPLAETTRRSASTEKSMPRESGIPGLSLSTQPVQPTNRNLKRPVASDFDSYSSPGGTLKRTRTQDTLIIDVSDDEDVEMDMGSPTDEPNSASDIINPPPRPLGAFPPLPDHPNWRQRSSPGSSAVPPKPSNGTKLDLLTKRIEEARRKIAEAEAKKAATKPNVTQSPQPQTPAVESTMQLEKLEIPKARDEARKVSAQRRERIVSYELPSVDASLKEKQEMYKEAVARAAQLELEIQASIEERDKLTTEIEELAKSPEPTPSTTSVQAPPAFFAEPNASFSSNHVIESQVSTEQETSMDQTTDESMDEGEDVTEQNPRAVSSETRPDIHSVQPDRPASKEHLAATATTIQSPQNQPPVNGEPQVGTGFGITVSDTTSVDLITENGVTDFGAIAAAAAAQPTEQEQPKANGSESLLRDIASGDNESYRQEAVSSPSTHNTPFSGHENGVVMPLLGQDKSVSLVDKSPSHPVLTETGPRQPFQKLTPSAPVDPSGQVQNSSSHEHPSLTETQDEPEQAPQVEDLLSYRSPLSYFRAYRFHPNFFDEVAGGLKSMTYSSRIDPMRPLCPYMLSEGQCPNGNACEFQHFDSMVVPDAEIITQLGSSDMFTGETRNKFIEGLKKVLNDLKANKVKDFDRITRAIVKHRQEFLEDKSKVLPLDTGTS